MTTRDEFLELMRERFACKLFDSTKSIPSADIDAILECARLSPSSFGIEPWHFFAVTSRDAILKLRAACFDQDAVGTASLVVVAVCRKAAAYRPDGDFVRSRGSRFPGGADAFVDEFRGYHDYLAGEGIVDQWARAQCYIACANMMNGAKAAGVDSCAIEGFDNAKILSALSLDGNEWLTGIVTSFGYSAKTAKREKIRMDGKDVITRV